MPLSQEQLESLILYLANNPRWLELWMMQHDLDYNNQATVTSITSQLDDAGLRKCSRCATWYYKANYQYGETLCNSCYEHTHGDPYVKPSFLR